MNRLCLCLVLGIALLNVTLAKHRAKRQSDGSDNDVEDRYGFDRPGGFPGRPNRPNRPNPLPGQNGRFPWQNGQNQLFPGQNGQSQFPGQNGQNQFQGQNGQNQFQGQNGQNQLFPGQNGQNQFPGQNGQNQFQGQSGQNQFQGQNGQNQSQGQNGQGQGQNFQSTTESATVQECIRNCPVTAEYNPVCGTNSMTYTNPGRLTCAQSCGVGVSLLRASPCPSTTTAAPAV